MKTFLGILVLSLVALAVAMPATSQSLNRTFVVQLSASEEVPLCAATDSSDRAVALFKIVDVAAGVVEYTIVASDLPGTLTGAHIHGPALAGDTASILQPLDLTGAEVGVIAAGTFTDAQLVAEALANPELFYVNVHTTTCLPGAIRGQIG
jgi:CHRD domain